MVHVAIPVEGLKIKNVFQILNKSYNNQLIITFIFIRKVPVAQGTFRAIIFYLVLLKLKNKILLIFISLINRKLFNV